MWDPTERMKPLEAMVHPWILEGLPRQVLVHHYNMLGLELPDEMYDSEIAMEYECSPPESSIKFNKVGLSELSSQREHHLVDELSNEDGDDYRDNPSAKMSKT